MGTTLVWGQIPAGSWKPAILWLRTARDLVPVQNLLNESEGEIHYVSGSSDAGGGGGGALLLSPPNSSCSRCGVRPEPSTKCFRWPERLANLKPLLSSTSATSPSISSTRKPWTSICTTRKTTPNFCYHFKWPRWSTKCSSVCVHGELCRRKTQSVPGFCRAATRTLYRSLVPANKPPTSQIGSTHAALCPSIARGLDRAKILQLLQRRGCIVEQTKDVAASLSCELLPVNAQTIQAERLGRNFA